MEAIRVLRVEIICITSEALQVDMLKYQLQKLECAKAAYLWLPFLSFGYLSFPSLSLPFLTFPYLSLSFLTFPYLSFPYLPCRSQKLTYYVHVIIAVILAL